MKLVLFYASITRLTVTVKVSPADPDGLRRTFENQAHADTNAAENIRQGRSKKAERDVVENRLLHSFRFRRLSAAVTNPRLEARVVYCKSNKKARWAPEGSPQRASFPVSFAWNQNTARRL